MTDKLYLVVRANLPNGDQAVQAAHAAIAFAHEHPDIERKWYSTSNTLALLTVPDEQGLERLLFEAARREIATSAFREPDLNDSLTAIAIAPSGSKIVRNLPLAFA